MFSPDKLLRSLWLLVIPFWVVRTPAAEVRFNRDIRPLLSDRCFHCHGPDEKDRKAKLRLDKPDGPDGAYRERKGSFALKPGSVEQSELWARINSSDADELMPPPGAHKPALTPAEKELFRKWIDDGAKYEAFWAFVAPTMPELPKARKGTPIDRFVERRLSAESLAPAPRADRRSLIRRLSFDLTGLPPSREEIREFLADQSPQAYENLIEHLLKSPHYGEHMAKYWLDLVRFADSNGIHHDHYREMSPYRDWVIRAFNDNLPFDDFTRFQLAGDLYPDATKDQLIASGFNRLHLIIDVGTALPEEGFTRNVLDRVTSVGTAFMGLTVQCAVCHDHKYDPITQKDFYSLFAFFNNLDAKPETGRRSGPDFFRGMQEPYISLASEAQEAELKELEKPVAAEKQKLAQARKELKQAGNKKQATAKVKAAEKSVKAAEAKRNKFIQIMPAAMVMKEREEIRPAHILIRGAYDNPGDEVGRDTPAFLPPSKKENELKTRMDLANWFVDPGHPLTARVTVNRFWQQLFGVGLVRTSEDFGAQGEWPTHPDLLDYLAVRFVKSGWDVKALLREIVMSETYQQSAVASAEAYERDPTNRLLARGSRFRMDSEMIRDQILATSGQLNRKLYGKSVKPPQPVGLWKAIGMPSSYPKEYVADSDDKIYRRSVYTFWKRGMPPPQMTILNAPSREECIARRERTNTPLQALLLLNEEEYLKASRQLAAKALSDFEDSNHRIDAIYEVITSQMPNPVQRESFRELVRDLQSLYRKSAKLATDLVGESAKHQPAELAAWTMLASAIYNLDVTKTRQ
ncbi:MAG: DUF1553 domain-containing protein [Limisphaerales bacterium]